MNLLLEAQALPDGAGAIADAAQNMTGGGAISLGITVFAAACVIFGIILGLRRGFTKTLIRIITVVAAAAISYFLSISLTGQIDILFADKTLEEVILSVYPSYETAVAAETREIIAAFDAETAQLILDVVVAIIVSPLLFIISFYVVKAVLLIVYWLLCAILGKTNRNKGFFSTLFGSVLGAAQGAIVALVVMLPVAGFLSLAGEVRTELTEREDLSAESAATVENFYSDWLDEPIAHPLVTLIGDYGGDELFTNLTDATVDGEDYDMREKATLLAGIYIDSLDLKGMDWRSPTEAQQADLERILHNMNSDEYMARILAGVLRGASTAIVENIDAFPVEEPFSSLFVEAFGIFQTSDATNVEGDLATMLHVYFIMCDNDILVLLGNNDLEGLKNKLAVKDENGTLIIDAITDELHENERTDKLITVFTKLSISIMADQLGLSEDVNEKYENVKDGLNEVLEIDKESFETEDEYRAAITDSVSQTLEENGINLDDEIVEGMSDYIADNYSELSEITDKELNDVILSYYSSSIEYKENNPDAELPDEIPEDILDNLPGANG